MWPATFVLNRSYGAMAEHYHVGIFPARPYRPKDKAMASYCTLFEVWYGDGLQPGWTRSPPAAAFENCLARGQLPEATV